LLRCRLKGVLAVFVSGKIGGLFAVFLEGALMKRAVLGTGLAILGALGVFGPGALPAHAADATAPDTFTVVSASLQGDMLVVVTDTAAGSTLSGLTSDFQTDSGTSWVGSGYQSSMTKTIGGTTVEPDGSTQDTWDLIIPYSPTSSSSGLAVANGYGISLIPTWADAGVASSVFDQGPFNFTADSYISLDTPSNTSFTYGTSSVTLSGTVTITAPDFANDTVDLTRGTVSIVDGADDVISVGGQTSFPVSSTGTYSIPGFTPRSSRYYYAVYSPGNPAVSSGGSSGGVGFTVTSVDSSITVSASPVTETYPKTGTVTGTLKNGSVPLANQSIWVSTSPADATTLASGTTSSTGAFSITIPAEAYGTTLYVGSAASTFVYAATPVAVGLNVVHPTAIDSLTVSLNQYWGLSVKGCLTLNTSPADRSESFTSTAGLELQYLNPAASKPVWRNLQAINAKEALSRCGVGGTWFTTKVTAPLNAADYRVVYVGTTGATRLGAATSSAVLAWRYADRIINAKMTKSGKKLTFSGTLQYYYSGWHNYSGQKVYVELEPKGSSTWYYIATPVTNSTGSYRITVTDPVSAHWQVVFEGNNNGVGHLATGTPIVYVAI
jgi:hypothetical protein